MLVTMLVTGVRGMRLKNEQVAEAVKAGAPVKLSDGKSLFLIVRKPGKAYWTTTYRTSGGKHSSKSLGPASSLTLAAARRAREAFSADRRRGLIVSTASVATVAGIPRQAPTKAAGVLFGEAHATYREDHASGWSERQQIAIARLFKNHTGPLDGLPVGSITVRQVADVLRPIWIGASAGQGARLRQLLERVFRAAGVKTDDNPAALQQLENVLPRKRPANRKKKPYASMPASELAAFMIELAGECVRERKPGAGRPPNKVAANFDTVSRCLRFCILTAVRSAEAIGADWSEIDLDARTWTIPAKRMKMDEPHTVPLSDAAIALLGKPGTGRVFVVSSTRTGAINKDGLMKYLREYRSDVTVHGFRSTFASWAEEAGHMPNVIEAALAHEKGDATTRAYLRSKLLPARRKLMDAWASYAVGAL
jgi:integrase